MSERYLITGAAGAIGRELTLRALRRGDEVVAVDRAADGLAELTELGARTVQADLARDVEAVVAAGEGVTRLVNAAGLLQLRPIDEVDEPLWDATFAVNVKAAFFVCQGLLPGMAEGSAVVNVASTSARRATTLEAAPYAASKAALLSVTRSFAYAHAHRRIRVNAVCPGIIDTPMQDRLLDQVAQATGTAAADLERARLRDIPLGRRGTAQEVADLVEFLLSDAASYLTGQAVDVSGGLVMW